jgi:hypothetical protein
LRVGEATLRTHQILATTLTAGSVERRERFRCARAVVETAA